MDWQPIETAPRDGTEFLGYGDNEYYITHWQVWGRDENGYPDGWECEYCDDAYEKYPDQWMASGMTSINLTHWMPLPAPPEL